MFQYKEGGPRSTHVSTTCVVEVIVQLALQERIKLKICILSMLSLSFEININIIIIVVCTILFIYILNLSSAILYLLLSICTLLLLAPLRRLVQPPRLLYRSILILFQWILCAVEKTNV